MNTERIPSTYSSTTLGEYYIYLKYFNNLLVYLFSYLYIYLFLLFIYYLCILLFIFLFIYIFFI